MIGFINLIPKPGKDARILKNLRPITLLNVDYKIVEKILANRLQKGLSTIIHYSQKGFMKNKQIAINIRKIFDIMMYCEEEDIQAVILSIDFQKCFDMIEFNAIFGSLHYFRYQQSFINIRTTYHGFQACVQNNGNLSNRFMATRSVHQGGPNSSFLFLVCAEVLAIALRNNTDLQGIPIEGILNLFGQFADDMDMYLKANEQNMSTVFNIFEWYRLQAGFTINYDKTTVYRIGSLRKTDAMIYTERKVQWTNKPINVLGVWVASDIDSVFSLNYDGLV